MSWIAVRVGLASSREGGEWSSETSSWGVRRGYFYEIIVIRPLPGLRQYFLGLV